MNTSSPILSDESDIVCEGVDGLARMVPSALNCSRLHAVLVLTKPNWVKIKVGISVSDL